VFATGIFAGSSAVTWMLRAAPFALLAPIRHSALRPYLNENMPVGIVTILVFYTVRHVPRPFRR
jgi:branched-subunit amino acid transport protein AzlD